MTPNGREEADRRAARARTVSRVLGVSSLASGGIAIASGVASRNVHGADMGGVMEVLMLYAASLILGGLALLLGLIAVSFWASSRATTNQ